MVCNYKINEIRINLSMVVPETLTTYISYLFQNELFELKCGNKLMLYLFMIFVHIRKCNPSLNCLPVFICGPFIILWKSRSNYIWFYDSVITNFRFSFVNFHSFIIIRYCKLFVIMVMQFCNQNLEYKCIICKTCYLVVSWLFIDYHVLWLWLLI